MMTRKHFEAIAEILNFASDKTHPALFSKIVNDFALMCARENPNFDVNKFHEASGYRVPNFNSR